MNNNCPFQEHYPDNVSIIKAPKGRTIFMPYQPADYIYHLHSGIACTIVTDKKGAEKLSLIILPDQFIGLAGFAGMDMKHNSLHTEEARAVTPIIYCKIKRELVWELTGNSKVKARIYDMISAMINISSYCGLNMVHRNVYDKVYFTLNILASYLGQPDRNKGRFIHGITHSDIALLTNCTRVSVSRTLKKLEDEQLIKTHRYKIEITNPLPVLKSVYR